MRESSPSAGDSGGGRRPPDWLDDLVEGAVRSGAASAAAALLVDAGGVRRRALAGRRRLAGAEPPRASDLFDLASLTKPAVAALALELDAAGDLPLATRIGEIWSGAAGELAERSLEELLRHRGGLLPWAPLYRLSRSVTGVGELLSGGQLAAPADERYSDLGYILWGLSAERATGRELAELLEARVVGALDGLAIRPAAERAVECAADTAREVELAAASGWRVELRPAPRPGEPQDGNARFLGGIAGHAGLFGSADGAAALARIWIERRKPGLAAHAARGLEPAAGRFALGWARPGAWPGTAGLPEGSFGHLGFTGATLWAEPASGAIGVLLMHRREAASDLGPWRRRFYDGLRSVWTGA